MRKSDLALQVLVFALTVLPSAAQNNITVYSAGSVAVNQTRQLTAYVPLSPNTVMWSVNGVTGGDSTNGTVSTSGLYRAPMAVPMNNVVKVRATSTAYAAKYDEVAITITQPVPQLWSIYPTSVPAGNFTISLNGANYSTNSVVNIGGTPVATTFVSATALKATSTATQAQAGTSLKVTVTSPGFGAVTTAAVNLSITAAPAVNLTISPTSASVNAGATRQFTASASATWSVNGILGGNATVGTVSTSGLYTAPAAVPSPSTVTVAATSTANTSVSASAAVTILPPAPAVTVVVSPSTATVAPSASQTFTASVTGSTNTGVSWSVNNVAGGNATAGTITAAGVYTAPAVIPSPSTVTIRATSVVNTSSVGSAALTIAGAPNPGNGLGTPHLSASRFLEQAAFGPTPTDVARVEQIGVPAWLTEQFNMPETAISNPGGQASSAVQQQYLNRLSAAPDQLRQKVAYALSQIIVISMNKNIYPDEIVPYLQILSRNAFGNYRTLLGEITTSSQMGKYLDLARSTKPGNGSAANENYPRELMQLFSIGIYELNPDGSQKLDGAGKPIQTYTQATIQQVALALTGWVYKNNAWEDFSGPMVPNEANHDTTQKTFYGCTLPAGQTTTQDTNATLDCIFNHPNVGPFVATRLIRALVLSNPSSGYIQRIASVFNNNGAGVRGDLKAVVNAILTDPEARNDTAGPTSGRLKDPIYNLVSFVRSVKGSVSATNQFPWMLSQMGQTPLTPPSVFSFYSPGYRMPKSVLFGPEFQIYTPTEAVLRGNLFWGLLTQAGSDVTMDLTPFTSSAGNLQQLIDACDQTFLYGRMPSTMRQSLATAITAQSDNTSRWQVAVYLTALSGYYAVQY